jgi:hypothetical protein
MPKYNREIKRMNDLNISFSIPPFGGGTSGVKLNGFPFCSSTLKGSQRG